MPTPYNEFIKHVRETGMIDATSSVLDWDAEVNMPENGLDQRAEQLSLLAALGHERRISPRLGEWLSKLEGKTEDEVQETNVREMRRAYDRAIKIPTALVERIAHVSTLAKESWAKARKESAFSKFVPHLKELLDLKRQVADAIGYKSERYDALLDEFEPGATAAEINTLFNSLRGPLSDFVKKLADAPKMPDVAILNRNFPIERQKLWSRQCAMLVGFDFNSGRIDVSTHPFCSGFGPGDVRLTTRYYEDFFSPSMFGTLHESGHGLYEQGLPREHVFTPRGQAASLGIHESQSRMWENMVGRSRPFWDRYYEQCRAVFHESLSDISIDRFYAAINAVSPSLIRVEADEVTYNLHIILRFEIERELLENRLKVEDLPEAWNAKIHQLLGVNPTNDAEGCLQDIHWSMAAFGYFPTYALGNLYAAQFFVAAKRDMPDLDDQFRRGEFSNLLGWLRKNIHQHGMRYRPADLVKNVTGSALSIEPFLKYVREKFSPIYGLQV
ncbi:MAG: carboxypeptidase M32 [Planctomycetes bacterium]|nr:carboxypeptidase M32 [Planctomycetota bacterium]